MKATKREVRLRDALHEKLGPVIRLGPHELSINDAAGVKTAYSGGVGKTAFFGAFNNFGEEVMFSTIESKPHTERKRMLSHVYSNSYIQNSLELSKILDAVTSNVRDELLVYANEDTPIDIYKLTKSYGLDITTAYSFGLGVGTNFVQASRTSDPLKIFEHILSPEVLFFRGEIPARLGWLPKVEANFFGSEISAAWSSIEDLCFGMSQKANLEMQAKTGLLDEEKGEDGVSRPEPVYARLRRKLQESGKVPAERLDNAAAAEMLDHMFAGNEGIGIALSYLAWELSAHPEIQRQLQEEVRHYFVNVSVDEGALPSGQALEALPVLNAVLQETMRLYPSAPGPFPRIVPPKGAQFEGVNVPGGTVVSSSAYSLQRNPNVFPHPEEWKPQRWIGVGDEERREMMRWFWVFGSGGRMCIGNHLAVRMMKACVAAIYSEFESASVPGATMPEQFDGLMGIPEGNSIFLKFHKIA